MALKNATLNISSTSINADEVTNTLFTGLAKDLKKIAGFLAVPLTIAKPLTYGKLDLVRIFHGSFSPLGFLMHPPVDVVPSFFLPFPSFISDETFFLHGGECKHAAYHVHITH